MFDSQQFSGIARAQSHASTNPQPLYARVNPEEQPLPQAEYERQVTPQEDQSSRQVWSQADIPPQAPELMTSQQAQAESKTGTQMQTEKHDYFEHLPKPLPEETILTWKSAGRPFKQRNRQFYTTVATIVVLISLILFFAGQMLPIAVVISMAFLYYVLSSVPPQESEKKITTYGIRVDDQLYYWEEMGRFWFDEKYGSPLLQIEIIRFPGRLTLLLGGLQEKELEEILREVLIKEKPKDTFFDKAAKWLQEKIPLDNS